MQIPLQISFRNFAPSQAVAAQVKKRVQHLQKLYQGIIGCRVVLEAPHRHQRTGKLFHIRIAIRVRGEILVVNRDPALHKSHTDLYVTLHDAFDAAEKVIQSYIDRRRFNVKIPHHAPSGRVTRILYGDGGYGFLEGEDGQEYYFHRNSVLHEHFDSLEVGAIIRYSPERGEQGLQASTVELIRNPLSATG